MRRKGFHVGIFTAVIVVGSLFLYFYVRSTRPVFLTPRYTMKHLPFETKQKLTAASPSAAFRVPILLYHYVEIVKNKGDTIRQSLTISPPVFEQQIKTLQDGGYTFMTMRDLGEVLDGKKELPLRPVLITVDDGHWDLSTDILPILKKYNIKVTAYIVPGLLGGGDFLTKKQLQSVIDSGLVEIGAHTMHHVSLKGLATGSLLYEVNESKAVLEKDYHLHVVTFAYPNGAFDEKAIEAVKNAGFSTSLTTVPGIMQSKANRYFLYRLRPGVRVGKTLLDWLAQNKFRAF